jgi:hypothetical protein
VSAAASIIFIGTIRSFLEKKKPHSSHNSGNLNTKYFGRVLRTEKADVNITLTAETAMASIKAVKKAYHILLLNIDTVIPKELLDRILHQILTTDGKHWSCGLPTFDELAKNQKNEALRGDKEMEIVHERNRERERESDREMKKMVAEKNEKLAKKNIVTVIPHLLGRARNKDEIDIKVEKSSSTIPFLPCPAPPLNYDIQQKILETDSNAKNIVINQYIVKSEISKTDCPLVKNEFSQNRAECRPTMSSSLTIKEEKEMNHAKSKIRFDIGDMENNSRSAKNKEVRFVSHLDMKEEVGAGVAMGMGIGVGNQRDQYKHEDSIPMGGMGVLSTRKLQKISS